MAEFVGHESCPECGSADNLARYDDGSAYCFGCQYTERADSTPTKRQQEPAMDSKSLPLLKGGEHQRLKKRRLSEETCKKFDYRVAQMGGRTVQVANYRDGNKVVSQKIRDSKKNFTILGKTKAISKLLFGQHLWRDDGKRLVITEGEIDAMSVSQAQGNKWPVVSVPNGAQGARKSVAANVEWIEHFETVVFCFDQDEPGQDAAKECAAILSPGKAAIARLPLKDANDMLVAGKGKDLIDALWAAKTWRPDGVVDVSAVAKMAAAPMQQGSAWPWKTLTDATYGRRRKELYGFGGGTGCGKSTLFKQIALHIMEKDNLPVGMIMLEEPPSHTLKTLAGMSMGVRVHVPGAKYSQDDLTNAIHNLDNKAFFYDHYGSQGWAAIKEKIRYMVVALGCKDIFLDHLTALAASIDTDERKAIDKIMAEMSALVQELNCTLYYISHLTTPDGTPHEEGGRVLEKQFRGSRSIAYWSHFLFAIERDKQSDDPTVFRVLKDRYTGDSTGVKFGLRYSRGTGLLDECDLPSEDGPACSRGTAAFEDGDEF